MIKIHNPDKTPGYVIDFASLAVVEYGLNDVLKLVPEQDRAKAEKYLQLFMDSHQTLAARTERTLANERLLLDLFGEQWVDSEQTDIKITTDQMKLLFRMAWIHQSREWTEEHTQKKFIAFRAQRGIKWTEVRFPVTEEGLSLWAVIRTMYDIGLKLGQAHAEHPAPSDRMLRELAFRTLVELIPENPREMDWARSGPTDEFIDRLKKFISPGPVSVPQIPGT